MNAALPDSLRRILAIRLDNIGDVVMTGPALREIKRAYPNASLTLMASPAGSQVVPLLPWVDDLITWRAVWQDIGKNVAVEPEKEFELVDLLKTRAFDAAFIFTSFSQSPHPPAYAGYLAGIPIRVGQTREFGGGLLSHWVRPLSDNAYQVERSLHLLRGVGIPVEFDHLELGVQSEDQESADAILASAGVGQGQPFIALAPGASAVSRRYDEARFAKAALQIHQQSGLPVVLLGSQREMGKFPILESAAADGSPLISLIGQTSVAEMGAIIRRSVMLIGNNSGAMHIAGAFQRPMVILFAGTELLDQWAPRTSGARILNRPTPCARCHAFECPYQLECLDIPAEEVAAHALDLINNATSISKPLSDPHVGPMQR